jgi:predicted metal-dependent RNase
MNSIKQNLLKSYFKDNYITAYYQDYRLVVELKEPFKARLDKELIKQLGNYVEIRPNLKKLDIKSLEEIFNQKNVSNYKINNFNGSVTIFDKTHKDMDPNEIYTRSGYLSRFRPSYVSKTSKQIEEIYYNNLPEIFNFRKDIAKKMNSEPIISDIATITFLGGASEVGRSCYLIKTYNSTILLESGLTVKSQTYEYPLFDFCNIDLNSIDAIVISHAHLDHGGFLPSIFKAGYDGPVYMTKPTQALLVAQHLDLLKLNNSPTLFDSKDIIKWIKNTIPVSYGRCIKITNDINIVLQPANHLLGASMVYFSIGKRQILFTGDYKYNNIGILPRMKLRKVKINTLISQATYANLDKEIETYLEAKSKIQKLISNTHDNQGYLLIPTLSIGRSQEIILLVNELMSEGLIPDIPIYVEGAITETTSICQDFKNYYKIGSKIDFSNLSSNFRFKPLQSYEESCVIITTSGMFEGGPITKHLINLGNKPNTTILINTAQVTTLGKTIKQKQSPIFVKSNNIEHQVDLKAKVQITNYFSGHSNESELYKFIRSTKSSNIILIHCDYDNAKIFSKKLKFAKQIYVPRLLETLRL